MRINYTIKNIDNFFLKELARPWIYMGRHFSLVFGSSEQKITAQKVDQYAQPAIKEANEDNVPIVQVFWSDRAISLLFLLLDLIPLINLVVATYERIFMDKLEIINDDLPDNKLRTSEAVIPHTKQGMIDGIYDIFEDIHAVLTAKGIKYSMCAGSQLGATRHGGIIPWDDDGDMAVEAKDREAIEASLDEEFKKRNCEYYIDNRYGLIKIFKKDGHSTFGPINLKSPFVDIFFIAKRKLGNGQEAYCYTGESSFEKWGNKEYFTKKQCKSITDVKFGHLNLKGLPKKQAMSYLNRAYGNRCMKTGVKTHEHDDFTYNRFAERVRITDFNPAKHSKVKTI